MKKIIWIIFLTVFLVGCATGKPLTWEDIYAGPFPDCESIIKKHLQESLFDPDSLRDFSMDSPCQGTTLTSGYPKFNLRKGQEVYECKYVWYNAKNRMGGYVGKKPHIYWIRYNEVVAVW
ncbi:MAG: hypothetical protein WC455_17580 [Dehalococcoidia bacterium]|jgi:hypothetical protein